VSLLEQLSGQQAAQLEQDGELWHLYRRACADSLYFFTKAVWTQIPPERNKMSKRCHLPICLTLEDLSIRRLLVEWPRRHMKSTIVSETYPVWRLVQTVVAEEDPNVRFGLYSSTTTNSQRFWRSIRSGFETNELFQFLFPELIPDFGATKVWNEMEGKVPRLWDPKEPTFDCLGGGKATSRHYDEIVEDDMINEENFDSPTGVAKALEYHRQAENLLEDDTGRIVVVGNRWGMFDLNSTIHAEETSTAVLTASCYGANLDGKYKCRHLPESVMEILAKIPHGEPLWPERFSLDGLARVLEKEKPRMFSSQYLNNPSDPDAVDFKADWLQSCEIVRNASEEWCIKFEGDPLPTPLSHTNLYVTWDPALDGKHSTSRNAVCVSAIDSRGRIAVLEDYARKEDPLRTIDVFLDMAKRYEGYVAACGVEEVLFQRVLGSLLKNRARSKGVHLNLRKLKVPPGKRKDQRIRAWVGSLFEDRKVYVRRGCVRFIEEYTHFGVEGMTVDIIDAFAHASQLWRRPRSQDISSEEKDTYEEVAEQRGVTGYGSALATV
jgi:hypothetical protein